MVTEKRTDDSVADGIGKSTDPRISRRRLLQTTGAIGVGGLLGSAPIHANESSRSNQIELEAIEQSPNDSNGPKRGSGGRGPPAHAGKPRYTWRGIVPAEIDRTSNPTLSLVAGETYTLKWTNRTGKPHNVVIVDGDGTKLQKSSVQPHDGETQTIEFTATEAMAEYYSQTNRHEMRGTIEVGTAPELEVSVLVFSATAGYRHGNIEYGIEQLTGLKERIAAETGAGTVTIETITDDASAFPQSVDELENYDAIVWFNTTGDVLNADQQAAFESYMQRGGGYAGIHAATDTEYDWEFYGDMLGGAYFDGHPAVQEAEITVTDRTHPSTNHLSERWTVTDEWYDFADNPRGSVHVLATIDEDSYEGAGMSRADHPICWCRNYRGGRAWYTGRGHTEDAFDEDAFLEHVLGGILWASGLESGGASGTVWANYQKTLLTDDVSEPMRMDVAPDGRLFYTERESGTISVIHPDDGSVTEAMTLDVYAGEEDGLQGIALDPAFEETGWVYCYYSPPEDVVGETPYNVLSRFTVEGATIDRSTETEILRVPTQRETCCHVGGDIAFGPDGELYLSTGDDTNPFASSGYAPIDERDGVWPPESDAAGLSHTYWDAQRTAANTNDLRGSILRIIPQDDGSYSVPEDNLFSGDEYADARQEGLVREEIYVMGCRNPFTLSVDQETGVLYYADYGPDAGSWDETRGPNGIVEFRRVEAAQNAGWPYVRGPNVPYVDYDFATETSGEPFDPAQPSNDSPNNGGLSELPPVTPATIYYPNSWEEFLTNAPEYAQEIVPDQRPWPSIPPGGAPMSGTIYQPETGRAERALPPSFDGSWFIMEWGADWLKYATIDESGNILDIAPFMPSHSYNGPMDLTVGPDGTVYLMEYGEGFYGGTNPGIYRVEHRPGSLGADAIEFVITSSTMTAGGSTTAKTTITNRSNEELTGIEFSLESTDGQLEATTDQQTTVSSIAPGSSHTVEWTISAPESTDSGEYGLRTQVAYERDGTHGQLLANETVRIATPLSVPFGLDAGGEDHDSTVSVGELTYESVPNPSVTQRGDHGVSSIVGDGHDIANTEADLLYMTEHAGPDIGYEIAVPNGTYDITLHFAEIWWGIDGRGGADTGAGDRVFDVSIQGEPVLSNFDIYEEAGSLTAVTKTIQDVTVSEAVLSITTTTHADYSKFSGIEIRSTDGDDGTGGEDTIDPETTIQLDGFIDGWIGTAPDGIVDTTNPTLTLEDGAEYTVEWTNADGAPHDFAIQDASGNTITKTDINMEDGAVTPLTFTATTEMVEYVCTVHPSSMLGEIQVL
ncbi:ThuA domain-containing protein [Halocatena halophila]|uniref:ThuA domain-containing protein n=1 Tax=Halocatena halophila TaxID=2814576 RepID=UPI002ED29613